MPATSKQTSNSRIEARRTRAAFAAFVFAGILFPFHARALTLERELRTHVAAAFAAPAAPSAGSATFEEMLLEVDVNSQGINKPLLVLRRGDGMFLMKLEDLATFRLRTPSTAPLVHDGIPYFAIDTLPAGRFRMDEVHQRLHVTAGADAFEGTEDVVPGAAAYPRAARPGTGAFLNYDFLASTSEGGVGLSNLTEAGIFTPYGVLVSNMIASNAQDRHALVRLESTFTSDFPSRHETLRIGDWATRSGAWGNAVHFGGIQYGTNFSTEPGFRAFPTQALRGQATVPSAVEVFVNNALIATRRVDPGPFTISNIPFTTGGGTVRLVVRDIANQQQVYTVSDPFYSSNTILKPGLSDYSVEAGKIREDFGLESFHYGDAFGVGTFRHGITTWLTGEVRAEASKGQRALGASASLVRSWLGQLDLTLAASQSDAGTGRLVALGFQRQVAPLSFGGQAQWASPEFRRLGQIAEQASLRLQAAASLGVQFAKLGAATLGAVRQEFYDREPISVASLGYSVSLGPLGQLNVTALRTRGERGGTAFNASVTLPLESNMSASAQYDAGRSGTDRLRQLSTSFQRNRSGDSPYSYRVATRDRDLEGVFDYRGDRIEAELGLARTRAGSTAARVQLAGGVGYLAGYAFLSRRITGSFGVVQVADYPDVAILVDNQFAGRTDAKGMFVIPDMRAYDRNTIAVRDTDLPLDASVGSLRMDASPYFRSGILIPFPVRHVRSGVAYLVLEDGTPMPSGALVRIEGQAEEFPVALRGEVYLNGFTEKNRLLASWKGQSCSIDVVYPDTADPLPDLGKYVCKGVQP